MSSTDMRKMAQFAASLAEAGHDAWSIVGELTCAADAEEFGWTGAAHFGVTTGVIPDSVEDEIRWAVGELIDANPRSKNVPKDKLREVIGE